MKITNFLKPFNCLEVPTFVRNNFKEFFINSDKVMILLSLIQWFIATFITSVMYDTYVYGFVSGGILSISLIVTFKYFKGTRTMRAFVAISMMLFSLIFIQQYLGRNEMHFHIFIAMAILTLYKDTLPIITAAATTIIHHLLFHISMMVLLSRIPMICKESI